MLTEQQKKDFDKAAQPLISFMKDLNPHAKCIVDSNCAELVQGIQTANSKRRRTEHRADCPVYGITPRDDEPCECSSSVLSILDELQRASDNISSFELNSIIDAKNRLTNAVILLKRGYTLKDKMQTIISKYGFADNAPPIN